MTFEPFGLYLVVDSTIYHADQLISDRPSLSSSLAATLISETPKRAWLEHPRLNPKFEAESDSKFDLGSAVHDYLSSGGARVRVIPGFSDYRKETAQIERDKLRAAGIVPLLEKEAEKVHAIVESVNETLKRKGVELGHQEGVFVAEDRGVLIRAMIDSWNPPFIRDFKVSGLNLANDVGLAKHIADLHYDLRAYFYVRIAGLVFPEWAGRIKYEWIFVEKDQPHGVRIVEADNTWLEMGRRKYESALGIWQKCVTSGRWPHLEGLSKTLPYPSWSETQWLERETKHDFVMGPVEMLKRMDDDRS